ncbi:MAG: glycosyltransferase [Acinetobacter sp.]
MISLIVPCYNAEAYIDSNINSILNQTDRNFEVIYINDGSIDTTGSKLKKIAEKYDFISVVSISNSGAMEARRKGLESAKYEYVTFLDVDDVISIDFIDSFNQNLDLNNLDILGSNFRVLNGEKSTFLNTFLPGTYSKNQFLESLCQHSGWELCGKIYKKSLFMEVNYPEKITIGEDALIFIQLVVFSDKIKIIDKYLYTYIQHPTSASHIKSIDKCRDGIKSAIYIKNFLKMNSNIEKKYLDSLILLFFSNSLRRGLLKRTDELFPEIKQSLNFGALIMLPLKKRIIVIIGFILMGLNF